MQNSHTNDHSSAKMGALMLGALGVVFGDIGTSPLYALKVSVESAGGVAGTDLSHVVLGVLSLITWAVILVVMIKYVFIIMRADNKGEGGIFALTALVSSGLREGSPWRWVVTLAGALGAALFFGDSMITPAISVLSAVEGLKVLSPDLERFIIPIALTLISGLFAIERFGTGKIGVVFGPVMLVWFSCLGVLGLVEILHNPTVFMAVNPWVGLSLLIEHPGLAVAILGSVVLAVTGGEALYADMGHFGRTPIQRAWIFLVFPCLLLNYYGQGALLLSDSSALDNPFYRLGPDWALVPMLILASLATIIASQSVISGAFSIATQAVRLGYIPRLRVKHTSPEEMGQVYVSKINILLFVGVVVLVLGFKSSEHLASAYGVSVTGAMAIDTILAGFLMIAFRGWNKWLFIPLFAAFFAIDMMFLGTNMFKFFEGGWLPVSVAAVLMLVMVSWITGRQRLLKARWEGATELKGFLDGLNDRLPQRVAGTAIFMVPHSHIVPVSMLHNIKHNKVIHERVILMHIQTVNEPFVDDKERVTIEHLDHNFHSVEVRFGFMEDMHIMRAVAYLRAREFHFSLMEISFFVGKEQVVATQSNPLLMAPFIYMHRSMQSASEYFKIPLDHAIELGGYVEI